MKKNSELSICTHWRTIKNPAENLVWGRGKFSVMLRIERYPSYSSLLRRLNAQIFEGFGQLYEKIVQLKFKRSDLREKELLHRIF